MTHLATNPAAWRPDGESHSQVAKPFEAIGHRRYEGGSVGADPKGVGEAMNQMESIRACVDITGTDPTSLLTIAHDEYLALARSAKVVSFDVFDTLLHRRVVLPRDIFALVGERSDLSAFAEARFAAEARARKTTRAHSVEVSLEEIYAALPAELQCDSVRVRQLELELEKEFTFANAAMLALTQTLRASGKRVIAVSDSYLTSAEVAELLIAKGFELDAVYTSCDQREGNCGKYNADLYPVICRAEGIEPSELLHAGDHSGADVANALSVGAVAVQSNHPTAHLITASEHYAAVMRAHGTLSSSLIAGTIARSKLDDAGQLAPSIESFGYDFGGPLVVGFAKHIIARCKALGIDHLVLLARDGCVVGDVLDALAPEGLTWRLMPASRRLAVFPAFAGGDLAKIKSLFAGQKRLSQRQILKVLRLEGMAEGLADADTVMPVQQAIDALKPGLTAQAQAERDALLEALAPERKMLADGRKFAWVDVGWALSSPGRLNELLGHDIAGFFIGSHGDANPSPGFEGYLFNRGRPHNLTKVAMRSVEIIELVFADWQPSAAYLRKTGDGIETVHYAKSAAETVRDAHIRAARRGVRRFAEDIRSVFAMLNDDELRTYNRTVWQRLCTDPPAALYKALAVVPHDALAGTRVWRTIGELWLPSWAYDTPDRKAFPTARAYRIAYLRRYLKWHLPPTAWNLLRRVEGVLRKYV